ncbi:MAG: RNA-binding protein [Candidatus Eremiobacteraeota bacterium]|nr:RNA-binding protein [Candidatus Eremiobacteraeota bacterium]
MKRKVYVGNLPYELTEGHIEELFSGIGKVTEVKLARDPSTGASKGFAFVEFSADEEAGEAIAKFNNYEFSSRKLKVDYAKERKKK